MAIPLADIKVLQDKARLALIMQGGSVHKDIIRRHAGATA